MREIRIEKQFWPSNSRNVLEGNTLIEGLGLQSALILRFGYV